MIGGRLLFVFFFLFNFLISVNHEPSRCPLANDPDPPDPTQSGLDPPITTLESSVRLLKKTLYTSVVVSKNAFQNIDTPAKFRSFIMVKMVFTSDILSSFPVCTCHEMCLL